jgi:hypothetical protein
MPKEFQTPMERAFWIPSLGWLLRYGLSLPEVGVEPAGAEVAKEQKDRIAALYAETIAATKVDGRLRGAALALASDVLVRQHPKVAPVLRTLRPAYYADDPAEAKALSPEWKKNWEYFQNWVAPEMLKPNREDQQACLGCHAVAGRVPSMELAGPDNNGFMSKQALWNNYRILMERVNETAVETSKLLRKPLNVQSGKEDGHQGGVRFNPNDRGYEILRRWVLDVAKRKSASPIDSTAAKN